MGSIKRIADIKQKRATACLRCGRIIPKSEMKNGTTFYCGSCGFAHVIKRSENTLTLTAKQKEEPGQDARAGQVRELEAALKESQKKEREWRKAAEGLARMVEEMKEKETCAL